jgi:SET domain-containing protein
MKDYIKLRGSSIHHKGVFASKDIPKGTRIIEYIGEKITKAESEKRADITLVKAEKSKKHGAVYIFELNKRHDIDGNVPNNIAKYINHSCSENCESDIIKGKIWIIASKDIKKGEELTFDYGYDIEDYEDHLCKCGSSDCIGYIIAEEYRPKLLRLLRKRKNIKAEA